jgi:competence protein ComEA
MQSRLIFSLISQPIIVISCLLAAAVLTCGGCGRDEADEGFTETGYAREISERAVEDSGKDHTEDEAAANSSVCVFVCGAVEREGVYKLPEGSRVIDAVIAAGGFSEDADRTYVNLAEFVYDTQRVEIPTLDEAEAMRLQGASDQEPAGAAQRRGTDGRVNINHASRQELMELPGIGESKAERIIAYRQAHGDFTSCEEVMNVNGIGEAMYENIKDHITVE